MNGACAQCRCFFKIRVRGCCWLQGGVLIFPWRRCLPVLPIFIRAGNTRAMLNSENSTSKESIRVKLMARSIHPGTSIVRWLRQFPGNLPTWGNCHFTFDPLDKEYDWLVVSHDLPRPKKAFGIEKLQCDPRKTLLITNEPSSITVYGKDFLNQFGLVLSSQEPWALPHPRVIFGQPGMIWYYGFPFGEGKIRTYDDFVSMLPPEKTKNVSTVCSIRQGRVTLHYKRFGFTQRLKEKMPELDVYGQGVNPISDKAEVIDPYKYHLTIENHVYPHHLTEKLPDIFLGYAVPFYYGCPNAEDYFPKESFIRIDIHDVAKSRDIIRSTLHNNEYRDRLPYVIEARRRVLEEYNIFPLIHKVINTYDPLQYTSSNISGCIMNRPTLRIKKPLAGVRSVIEKIHIKSKHILGLT